MKSSEVKKYIEDFVNWSEEVSARNKQNRISGKSFEEMIEAACEYYVLANVAEIEKTPEPRRVIGRTGGRNS